MTRFSSAHGRASGATAIEGVVRCAAAQLDGPPQAGLLFVPTQTRSQDVASAAGAFPFPLVHTTTAGHFTEAGRCDDEVIAILFADVEVNSSFVEDIRVDVDGAAEQLTTQFAAVSQTAIGDRRPYSSTLLLTDGLATTSACLIDHLRRQTRPHQLIVGGGAGDDGAFEATRVGLGRDTSETGAAALHFFETQRWGVGLGHGLRPATDRMTVTRATGATVHEIDERPALEAYEAFAQSRGVVLGEENTGRFMIQHELGIFFFDELRFARAPLRVLADGSIVCAAPIAEGSTVCILDGDTPHMLDAARTAAVEAKQNLRGVKPAGVLVFDCICRGLLFGEDFKQEIQVISRVFGNDVPVAGFLTYGEAARYGGRMQGWHNSTAVVVAIPAS